jgi:hypothetical protein
MKIHRLFIKNFFVLLTLTPLSMHAAAAAVPKSALALSDSSTVTNPITNTQQSLQALLGSVAIKARITPKDALVHDDKAAKEKCSFGNKQEHEDGSLVLIKHSGATYIFGKIKAKLESNNKFSRPYYSVYCGYDAQKKEFIVKPFEARDLGKFKQ